MKATSQETAYNHILNNIVAGKHQPNEPLREEWIAKECGLSSTPVREALRRLEREGWVESVPYRGSFIKSFSRQELEELFLMRQAMECLAARQAARNAAPEDLAKARAAVARELEYIQALPSGDVLPPPVDPDVDFHNGIMESSRFFSPAHYISTWNLQLRSIVTSAPLRLTLAELLDINDQHRSILKCVERKWESAAEELMKCHLTYARTKYMERYDEVSGK